MPRIKLTVKSVAALTAPTRSRKTEIYWDEGKGSVRGFGVQCSGSTSTKNFIAQRDINGRSKRVVIAGVNEITLEAARNKAADLQNQMRQGIDPKSRASYSTLRETLEEFRTARASRLKARSDASYAELVTKHLADWLDLPLTTISREMVEKKHSQIAADIAARERAKARESAKRYRERAAKAESWPEAARRYRELADRAESREPPSGHATANATMRALRALFNFAIDRNPELTNPVKLKHQWFDVAPREGLVKSDDMERFYKGIIDLENPVARDYLLLILFTGLRRREAAALRWSDIDLKAGIIRIPAANTKANRKLDLPMVDVVRDMLIARRSLGDGEFVFLANSSSGHIEEPRFALEEVAAKSGVRVSVHDLRRTFLTIAESCDISPLALKALVNHSLGNGDVTSGYIIMNAERLRAPAKRVASKLMELCGITEPAGVKKIYR
jgi:integrase